MRSVLRPLSSAPRCSSRWPAPLSPRCACRRSPFRVEPSGLPEQPGRIDQRPHGPERRAVVVHDGLEQLHVLAADRTGTATPPATRSASGATGCPGALPGLARRHGLVRDSFVPQLPHARRGEPVRRECRAVGYDDVPRRRSHELRLPVGPRRQRSTRRTSVTPAAAQVPDLRRQRLQQRFVVAGSGSIPRSPRRTTTTTTRCCSRVRWNPTPVSTTTWGQLKTRVHGRTQQTERLSRSSTPGVSSCLPNRPDRARSPAFAWLPGGP